MKLSLFVGGIVGIVLSSMSFFLMSPYLPGRVVFNAKLAAATGSQNLQALLGSFSVEYFQGLVASEQTGSGLPIRLKIPAIHVDAAIEYVGPTADGAMDVPKSQNDVAWFELGSRPGDSGSAAIAGHYGFKDGKGSVFDNLHKLLQGDKIYVEDDKGEVTTFVVTRARRYDPKADAADVFGSSDGRAHLNLITCEGVWDERTQQYSTRLVVFTDRE